MDGNEKLKFKKKTKYYNLEYLVIFLLLTGITVYLNNTWTSDKGYLLFIIITFGTISLLFWFILSTISYCKKSHLKNELFYYIGISLWNIIMTIEYFKIEFIDKHDSLIFLTAYFLIILLTLLPIKQIWTNAKQ